MNKLALLGVVLLLAGICLCKCKNKNVENFCKKPEPKPGEGGLVHFRQFSFIPYYMKNVYDVGKRGCHNSQYWDCITKHPDMKQGDEVSEDVHNYCAQYSNDQCHFPSRLSHSRKAPYYQTLDYS